MLFTDYHTHPQGHRIQPYAPALLQPWADSAREKGLREVAFTDHDRYHAGVDFDALDRLREANPDLTFLAGIELDNDPATGAAGRAWVEAHWDRLDFVLGSVHYLARPDQMFDSVPDGAGQFAGQEVDAVYRDYFRRVREIVGGGLVDGLAHLDLVKIHGHRPATSLAELAGETLDLIAARGLSIEVSTAGWRKPVNEQYPSAGLLRLALARGIPITVASDAHSHVQLAENYPRLTAFLADAGVAEVATYARHRRTLVPLASPG